MVHALESPVGLVETTAFPSRSTATQSDTVAHDTAYSCPLETATVVDVLEPPNGLVQVITRGPPSHVTATHSATDGHEIPPVPEKPNEEPAVVTGLQVRAPPAGLLDVSACPESSNATQSDTAGHSTAVNGRASIDTGDAHDNDNEADADPLAPTTITLNNTTNDKTLSRDPKPIQRQRS